MIDIICSYPPTLVMGGAALLGALINAGMTIYRKSKEEKAIKANILKHHSLDGVITLNKNSF